MVAETRGSAIDGSLPEDYVQLYVALPEAAAKAFAADPLAPAALLLPVAVVPADGGSTVAAADPVGQVWLYAAPPLRKAQHLVKARLAEVLEGALTSACSRCTRLSGARTHTASASS